MLNIVGIKKNCVTTRWSPSHPVHYNLPKQIYTEHPKKKKKSNRVLRPDLLHRVDLPELREGRGDGVEAPDQAPSKKPPPHHLLVASIQAPSKKPHLICRMTQAWVATHRPPPSGRARSASRRASVAVLGAHAMADAGADDGTAEALGAHAGGQRRWRGLHATALAAGARGGRCVVLHEHC